jgi:hypothetical protein
MNYDVITFWLFLSVAAICITLIAHLNRLAGERTIREAIERGVVMDAEAIHRLRGEAGLAWPLKLIAFGIVFAFLGMALAALGLILSLMEAATLLPLLGSGAFSCLFGIGLIVTGHCLRRLENRPDR